MNKTNIIDKQRILEALESASDYEWGFEKLDDKGKAIVKKLRQWGGDLVKVTGKKRKHTVYFSWERHIIDFGWIGSEFEKATKEPKKKPDQPADPAPPVFTKKENSTVAQRIEILGWYHKNGWNKSATARHFTPMYPNLKLKQPHEHDRTEKWVRQTEHPEVMEMMYLWVLKAMGDGILLTGEIL